MNSQILVAAEAVAQETHPNDYVASSPCPQTAPQDLQELERNLQFLQLFEANVAIEVTADIQALKLDHPEWFQAYEDAMPHTASAEELMELLISAPTPYAKGLIAGLCGMRVEMAAVSGRFF